jgi:hypothetical protein
MSIAVILITALITVIALDVIKFSKSIKIFFDGLTKESSELYEKINNFLEGILKLSFISKFFKKKKK